MAGNPDIITKHIIPIQSLVTDITKYYNTNIYDLKQFKEKFNDLTDKWMSFQNKLNEYASQSGVTSLMLIDLGSKMQRFYDSLTVLLSFVRKKY